MALEVKNDGTAYLEAAPLAHREKVTLTDRQWQRLRSLVHALKPSDDQRVFRTVRQSIFRIEARRGRREIKIRLSGLAHSAPRPPRRVKRLRRYLGRIVSHIDAAR